MREVEESLIIERTTAILTEIPLIDPIAAVSDRAVRTAARAIDAVTPANLLQQVRCGRFRDESVHWEHVYRASRLRCPCPLRLSTTVISINNLLHKSDYNYITTRQSGVR